VIAGFGLPGRAVADALEARDVPYCVVESNVQTVSRCLRSGVRIIEGDVTDEGTLVRAEIGRATLMAVTVPDEEAMLRAVELARRLNPSVRVVARATYISAGMKATAAGADEVVVAEQVVAAEFARVVGGTGSGSMSQDV
jgi:voltage-gated potassium channel Kch